MQTLPANLACNCT